MAPSHLFTPEVLHDILLTLQRLEMRLEDQNNSPSTVGCTISDADGSQLSHVDSMSSLRCSPLAEGPNTYFPKPLSITKRYDAPLGDISASEYMASVMKLRNRFEFDSCSDLAEPLQDPANQHKDVFNETQDGASYKDRGNDWCTMSVYSSRPLSRLEMDIPSVPSVPQHKTCTCGIHQMTGDVPSQTTLYDDMTTTASFDSRPSLRCSLSESERSTSTAISTAPSTPRSKQSRKSVVPVSGIYGSMKQSLKRSISTRSKEKAPNIPEKSPTVTEETVPPGKTTTSTSGSKLEPAHSLLDIAKKTAKTCISIISKSVSFVTRRLIEQQLKMLEVKA